MRQSQHQLDLPARARGLYDITGEVARWVAAQGIATGILTLFLPHTSASLLIQENADPDVLRDLETFFARLVPEDPMRYRHAAEGADDMPAHIRTALTQSQLTVPVRDGRLALGTWQALYLYEHRRARQRRHLLLHLIGA